MPNSGDGLEPDLAIEFLTSAENLPVEAVENVIFSFLFLIVIRSDILFSSPPHSLSVDRN